MKSSNRNKVKNGFLSAGRIVGAHGIRGEVKVHPHTEPMPTFEAGDRILLRHAAGSEETLNIVKLRPHKRLILFTFEGVISRDGAEALNNAEILIKRSALPDLEEGEYYWTDIIGLDVFCINETYLGSVESVIPTGSNDVYVIKNKENGRETLVPAIHSVITEIDIEKSIMRVDLPEGL
ncbi:MAG: 16S rRNA processing protein RimM [Deltaproteobacteria bacterium]|nr:16S rRNA processing protein RimM [Deltaproteobacteria bacterium]